MEEESFSESDDDLDYCGYTTPRPSILPCFFMSDCYKKSGCCTTEVPKKKLKENDVVEIVRAKVPKLDDGPPLASSSREQLEEDDHFPLLNLPVNVLLTILQYLEHDEVKICRLTNHFLDSFITNNWLHLRQRRVFKLSFVHDARFGVMSFSWFDVRGPTHSYDFKSLKALTRPVPGPSKPHRLIFSKKCFVVNNHLATVTDFVVNFFNIAIVKHLGIYCLDSHILNALAEGFERVRKRGMFKIEDRQIRLLYMPVIDTEIRSEHDISRLTKAVGAKFTDLKIKNMAKRM